MTSKCAECGKTVYFAERQSYDGNDFHGTCLQAFKKKQKVGVSGHTMGFSSYPTSGQPATSSKSSGGSGGSFCASCGAKSDGGKFCASCGGKL